MDKETQDAINAAVKSALPEAIKAAVPDAVKSAVGEAVKPLIADAIKPITQAQADLQKNLGVIADTLKTLPPAKDAAAGAADAGAGTGAGAAKPLTAEDVEKLLDKKLTAAQQAQQQTAEQKAKRDAFMADPANGLTKLPDAYKAQLGSDPTKWADESKAIVGSWEKFAKDNKIVVPDIGGAARDGGNAPGTAGGAEAAAKPGSWIKHANY